MILRGAIIVTLALTACFDPERDALWEAERLRYLDALGKLISVACPCGVARLEIDGGRLDQLDCLHCSERKP